MGNFLIILSSGRQTASAEKLQERAIRAARDLKRQEASLVSQHGTHTVTVFTRMNGTSSAFISDPVSGTWLLAAGSWFHDEGYGVGQETRLLKTLLQLDAERVAKHMEGFFVVAFGRAAGSETTVFTDAMGSCHAYLRQQDDLTSIAGSSLLLAALHPTEADPVGCQEFVQTGISYEDRTHYREVKKLDPATLYRFSNERLVSRKRYWSYSDLNPGSLKGRKAVDAFWQVLGNAASEIARDFPRISCDLTGGYDSRCVIAALLSVRAPVSAAVSGPANKPDVQIAKSLAASLGIPIVHTLPLYPSSLGAVVEAHRLTDGEFDPVEYAQILHVQAALSKDFDISLNGSYGGIARALWWELLFPHIGVRKPLDAHRLAVGRYLSPNFEPALFRPDLRFPPGAHLTEVVSRYLRGLEALPNTVQMDAVNLSMRIHRWQGRIASSTHQVWPCLSPLGLRSVLEVVLQSDFRLRLRSNLVRQMLAVYQPRLANFVLDRGYPAAPVRITNFHRFAPVFGHFAQRSISKAMRTFFKAKSPSVAANASMLPRLQLWCEEQTRDLLDPNAMKSAALFDPSTLAAFLKSSQTDIFTYDTQWNRLLSIELSFTALARFGASVRC